MDHSANGRTQETERTAACATARPPGRIACHSGRRHALGHDGLRRENQEFRGSGGVSEENRGYGFRPAFFDTETRTPYLSRFGNGAPAPCHILEGLPDELVMTRDANGRILALRRSVISGFLLDGRFYSREQAARKLTQMENDRYSGAGSLD